MPRIRQDVQDADPWYEYRLRAAEFAHHAGNVWTLAGPAGGWLHVLVTIDAGIARAQYLAQVFQTMFVPTRGVVMARESIASP